MPRIAALRTSEQENEMPATEARTQITQVRTIGVPVTDQDRAVEFYIGKLGFEKRLEAPPGGATSIQRLPPPRGASRPASAS